MVDRLEKLGIGMLFVIGGDGTLRGATKLVAEIERREPVHRRRRHPQDDRQRHPLHRSQLRLRERLRRRRRGHPQRPRRGDRRQQRHRRCVKLMGRHSGFIACHAALACTGGELRAHPRGAAAARRGARLSAAPRAPPRAAGARASSWSPRAPGRSSAPTRPRRGRSRRATDASGNARLKDIGLVLRDRIVQHFAGARRRDHPQVHRSQLSDTQRPRLAVGQRLLLEHGAQRGRTRRWPATPRCWSAAGTGGSCTCRFRWPRASAKQVDVNDDLWMSVIESTGQPAAFG